ncbi:MAG: cobyrinate a,c-diamide synthase [Thiohalocapsa sp.]|nr:cobyrinate a,c-diamide synthase [Thiohalocapsa sp.]MCF7991779.1 cobyrinate a,c-diamide synthase [Thiohalocapsa sp.]
MPFLYISAPQKSSGKTTLSIGLARELTRRGLRVQPFKKGPDYIDPLWLGRACGGTCYNLDFHTMPPGEIRTVFARVLQDADFGLIEGNVGLYDGIDLAGQHTNAELAKLLGAPVLLVIDTHGMSRGIAPLLRGYQAFDPSLRIAGVILNKVGGERHAANLRRFVEHYTDLAVVGAVPRDADVQIEERHLGLIPSNEAPASDAQIEKVRRVVAEHVDMDAVMAIAAGAPRAPAVADGGARSQPPAPDVRIGIARDDAFGFYYPDDLAALEAAGAELVPFSPVRDADLPRVDGLFIGGGFPECRMRELDENASMRAAVADFVAAGGPVYAECGGLMYLAERLHWGERTARFCGVLSAEIAMHERPRGRGYVRLRETGAFPWRADARPGREIPCHEFHHSAVVRPDPDWCYAYDVLRGSGVDGRHDGIVHRNLLASYAHLRDVGGLGWTRRFVEHVRSLR